MSQGGWAQDYSPHITGTMYVYTCTYIIHVCESLLADWPSKVMIFI